MLTLLRSHRDDDKGLAVMARHPYPMQHVRLRAPLRPEAVRAALDAAAAPPAVAAAEDGDGNADGADGGEAGGGTAAAAAGKGKKGGGGAGAGAGGGAGEDLKAVVGGLLPFGPTIAEHVVSGAGLDPSRRPAERPLDDAEAAALLASVRRLEAWFAGLDGGAVPKGFIAAGRAGGLSKRQRQKQAAAAAAAAAGGQQQPQAGGEGAASAAAAAPDALAAAVGAVKLEDGQPPAPAEQQPQQQQQQAGQQQQQQQQPGQQQQQPAAEQQPLGAAVVYEDFNPLPLAQHGATTATTPATTGSSAAGTAGAVAAAGAGSAAAVVAAGGFEVLEFATFDDALDEFYSKTEGQRADVAKADAERAAVGRLERVKQDQVRCGGVGGIWWRWWGLRS